MVRIHFNDTALRHTAAHRAPDREGRLLHRTSNRAYRERWFRLTGNLLFYFRTNDVGGLADATDPLGVMVLAACHVQVFTVLRALLALILCNCQMIQFN